MKVSEAEKLICPFMSDSLPFDVGAITVNGHCCNCITTKCMAWKNKEEYTEGKLRYVGEGYCRRLKNDSRLE